MCGAGGGCVKCRAMEGWVGRERRRKGQSLGSVRAAAAANPPRCPIRRRLSQRTLQVAGSRSSRRQGRVGADQARQAQRQGSAWQDCEVCLILLWTHMAAGTPGLGPPNWHPTGTEQARQPTSHAGKVPQPDWRSVSLPALPPSVRLSARPCLPASLTASPEAKMW